MTAWCPVYLLQRNEFVSLGRTWAFPSCPRGGFNALWRFLFPFPNSCSQSVFAFKAGLCVKRNLDIAAPAAASSREGSVPALLSPSLSLSPGLPGEHTLLPAWKPGLQPNAWSGTAGEPQGCGQRRASLWRAQLRGGVRMGSPWATEGSPGHREQRCSARGWAQPCPRRRPPLGPGGQWPW